MNSFLDNFRFADDSPRMSAGVRRLFPEGCRSDCDKDTAAPVPLGAENERLRSARMDCYIPFTMEQWVAAVFHVPESLIQVSLQITVRARCLPLSSAS